MFQVCFQPIQHGSKTAGTVFNYIDLIIAGLMEAIIFNHHIGGIVSR